MSTARKVTSRDFARLPVFTLREMCRDRGITEDQIVAAMDANGVKPYRRILVDALVAQANAKAGA